MTNKTSTDRILADGLANGEQTFSAPTGFVRMERTRDLTGVDLAVLGIPFDLAVTNRSGARTGPAAIRAGSALLAELKSFPWGTDPLDQINAIDCGDAFINHMRPDTITPTIQATAAKIIESGAFLVSFGGDHYVTYPLLKAHVAKYGPVALIHFDAHPDTWPESEENGPLELNHGTMFWRAVKEGLIIPERSVQIGIRTWVDDKLGLTVIDAPTVHEIGPKAVLERVKATVGDHQAYLTFDIDCLDPSHAPGTGTPVAGGLSTAQAFSILRGFGDLNLIGVDVVEVAAPYDHAEITAIAGATIAYDQICLFAAKRAR